MKTLSLVSIFIATVSAHSWLDCANWNFNNNVTNKWKDSEGTCLGYPRRFPTNYQPYGTLDQYQYFRHYLQDPTITPGVAITKPPCSQFDRVGGDGVHIAGSDERRGDPVSDAYDPNVDPNNYVYGGMTLVVKGQELCMRWPSKSHAVFLDDTNKVNINWALQHDVPDPLTQADFNYTQMNLTFRNCPELADTASPFDEGGNFTDRAPCGGCFTVPEREPGTYLVQWRWEANPAEWYASCADIQVVDQLPSPAAPCPYDLDTECLNKCGNVHNLATCDCNNGVVTIACNTGSNLQFPAIIMLIFLLLHVL